VELAAAWVRCPVDASCLWKLITYGWSLVLQITCRTAGFLSKSSHELVLHGEYGKKSCGSSSVSLRARRFGASQFRRTGDSRCCQLYTSRSLFFFFFFWMDIQVPIRFRVWKEINLCLVSSVLARFGNKRLFCPILPHDVSSLLLPIHVLLPYLHDATTFTKTSIFAIRCFTLWREHAHFGLPRSRD